MATEIYVGGELNGVEIVGISYPNDKVTKVHLANGQAVAEPNAAFQVFEEPVNEGSEETTDETETEATDETEDEEGDVTSIEIIEEAEQDESDSLTETEQDESDSLTETEQDYQPLTDRESGEEKNI